MITSISFSLCDETEQSSDGIIRIQINTREMLTSAIYTYKEMVVHFDICNAMSCSRKRDAYTMTNDAVNVKLIIN